MTVAMGKQITANASGKISKSFVSQQNTKQLHSFYCNILQKYYQLLILGTLKITGHFHQKQ